jgi:hypothetical protein
MHHLRISSRVRTCYFYTKVPLLLTLWFKLLELGVDEFKVRLAEVNFS